MRVSCATNPATMHESLPHNLDILGVGYYASATLLRAVYEGPDEKIGNAVISLFEAQPEHEVCIGDLPPAPARTKPELVPKQNKKHKRGHGRYKR